MNDLHDSYDSPPDKPIITGPPKVSKKKEETLSEVVSKAAVAFCYGH